MEVIPYLVQWKKKLVESGWTFQPLESTGPLSGGKFARVKSVFASLNRATNLRDIRHREVLTRYFQASEFQKAVRDLYINPSSKANSVYYFQMDDHWRVPWEFWFFDWSYESLKKASLLRIDDFSSLTKSEVVIPEKLSILVLEGKAGERYGPQLDIKAETDAIRKAITQLGTETRQRIGPVEVIPLQLDTLETTLRAYTPHLIWFNGHGKSDEENALLSADGSWLSADEFSAALLASHAPLKYLILSACDSAVDPVHAPTNFLSPAFFRLITENMPLTLIAMQSPISASTGVFLAREIFLSLAHETSIELAFSEIRASLKIECEASAVASRKMDWASPALWTNKFVTPKIQWNAQQTPLEELQLFALKRLTQSNFKIPSQSFYDSSEVNAPLLQSWANKKRLWLSCIDAKILINHLYKCTHRLVADIGLAPIVIDFHSHRNGNEISPVKSDELIDEIKNWITSLLERLTIPSSSQVPLFQLINMFNRTADIRRVWAELCNIPEIFLIIVNPPLLKDKAVSWFWDVFKDNPKSMIWCVSSQSIDKEIRQSWVVDKLHLESDDANVQLALNDEPELVKTLALLDLEIRLDILKKVGLNKTDNFENAPYWSELFQSTDYGPLINASAREKVIAEIKGDETALLHGHCLTLLDTVLAEAMLAADDILAEAMIFHAFEAKKRDRANNIASGLIQWYYERNLPYKVTALKSKMVFGSMDDWVRVLIGWAHLQIFELQEARFFLTSIQEAHNTLTVPQRVEHFALLAELIKNEGGDVKNECNKLLQRAMDLVNEARDNDINPEQKQRLLLMLRHDKIRILQYIEYDLKGAEEGYLDLVNEMAQLGDVIIRDIPVYRNLSECVRKQAERLFTEDSKNIERVETLLTRSFAYLNGGFKLARQKHPGSQLEVELLYENAKLDAFRAFIASAGGDSGGSEKHRAQEKQHLLDARALAKKIHSDMLLSVLEAKLFRRFEKFDFDVAMRNVKSFDTFTHGWAIRSQIDLLEYSTSECLSLAASGEKFEWFGRARELALYQHAITAKFHYLSHGRTDRVRIMKLFCRLVELSEGGANSQAASAFNSIAEKFSWIKEMLQEVGYRECLTAYNKFKKY